MALEVDTFFEMRKRFGGLLQARRKDLGLTQADMARMLNFSWPALVSQVETGKNALQPEEVEDWARVLELERKSLTQLGLYFNEPNLYAALFVTDPYVEEGLERPEKRLRASPGRGPLRLIPKA